MNITKRIEAIVDAVFDDFMAGNDAGMSVAAIAEAIGETAPRVNSAVGKMFDDEGYKRIVACDVYVPVRDPNYGAEMHKRRCRGFMPTRDYLRQQVIAAGRSGTGDVV